MCSFMSNEKIDALLHELRAEGKVAWLVCTIDTLSP
jgi:hypothetical protein